MSRYGQELPPPDGETQYDLLPPPANGGKYKQAAANPEDEDLLCRHMMHHEFGKRLAHILILRMARLAFGLNKVNMPTKPPVTSLAGHICPIFIAASVQCYTDVLYKKGIPAFHLLKDISPPEGYVANKRPYWYRPWTKAVLPATPLGHGRVPAGQVSSVKQQGATDFPSSALTDMEDGAVIRMAGAKQPTAPSQSQHLPKGKSAGLQLADF